MSEQNYDDDEAFLLEPDSDLSADNTDTDSALGDGMSVFSSTASLRSSLINPRDENGRKYHGFKDGKYLLPTDDEELERQEYQYALCLYTFGALSFAPLTKVNRVLDAGCGPGHWVIDFADCHPEAHVIGVDLSPVQRYTPSNASFEIDDLEEQWTFAYKFDYIHSLMMTGAFRDWPGFYRQAFEFLNKDGWLEIQDIDFPLRCADGSLPPGSALQKWTDVMMEASKKAGFLLNTCGKAADFMREVGFVDIVRVPYKWPIGRWPKNERMKELGGLVRENFVGGVESMSLALCTRFLGWSLDDVKTFAAEVRYDMSNSSYHTYFDLYVTYGRKP
ncbi:sam domain protein [Sporothrix schenckii 1099-18]|uniref:Sam domain protein n=1 Tax=Sporothrix schenckii 1099-18 TaxID=1397361 RepID=A0A0F2M5F4_SPOSC|nr:sam domain protein [Sporothrix schenckii 1099-18]KJR83426.1 sam domain protein [Sporothrix schenckii 1099-18]